METELINLTMELDVLTTSIRESQGVVIARMQANDYKGLKGLTTDMRTQLTMIKNAKKKIIEIEKALVDRKAVINKDFKEMERVIAEKENRVWQSSIGGLEV